MAMPTDAERREVARRLRGIDVDSIGNSYELLEEVANCIGCEGVKYGTSYGQFVVLLADLIEPPTRCPHYMHPCCRTDAGGDYIDRDALLALADEMEGDARYWLNRPCDQLGSHDVIGYAERIRKAVGVEYGD